MTLVEKILALAAQWAAANGHSSTARLSTIVANDGALLPKLEAGGNATLASLDKFVVYLRAPENWPDARLPAAASELLGAIGHVMTSPEREPEADAA